MSKDSKTETDSQQFWKMAVEAWQASGMSVRQFCKQEGLSEPSFYSWRKRLAMADKATTDRSVDCPSESFIQVSLPTESWQGLALLLSSGSLLRIPIGVDRQTLVTVFSALAEVDLC